MTNRRTIENFGRLKAENPETSTGFQRPKSVKEHLDTATNIVENPGWEELKEKAESENDPLINLMEGYFQLLESAKRGENNLEAAEQILESIAKLILKLLELKKHERNLNNTEQILTSVAKLIVERKLPNHLRGAISQLIVSILRYTTRNMSQIEHPYLHKNERDIALLWLGALINKEISMEEIYRLVAKIDYSGIHARNTGLLPVGFEPCWGRDTINLLGIPIPVQKIDNDRLSAAEPWVSNDHKKRAEEAKRIASFLSENSDRFGGPEAKMIVLDIGGGNGEGSHLIALAKELPPNAIIVIRELSEEMASEGRKKIKKLGLEDRVVFLVGDAQEPLDRNALEKIASGYKEAPVAAVVSSFNVGAMPEEVAKKAMEQAYKDAAPGALIVVYDFADPYSQESFKNDFLDKIDKAARHIFESIMSLIQPILNRCYENWRHHPENILTVLNHLNNLAGSAGFEIKWEITAHSLVPLLVGKESTACLVLPGYVQATISGEKPIKEE